jgi:DNA repair exonuclease SbcCD nuclease subunit
MFRFIHTADVHLDSPMLGLAKYAGDAAERIRTATRAALTSLVDNAIENQVAFVIIAGDLYDGDWRDVHTGLFFAAQMGRLADADILVFIVHGNHDAESQITKPLQLPSNVQVFSHRSPQTIRLDQFNAALHGQSFAKRDISDNLARAYPEPVPGAFNIGVLHTALTGLPGHTNYAPCSLDELQAKGYDYWALGHIHRAQVLAEHPHVVFPGNLQGRSVKETGPKGAHLVTVEDGAITDFATFHCDVVRWARVMVDTTSCGDVAKVVDRIGEELESAVAEQAEGRLLACRVELTGATPLHDELAATQDRLLDEAKSAALSIGADAAWIERVILATKPEAQSSSPSPEGLADVQGLIDRVSVDEELIQRLATALDEFCSKLPSDARETAEDPLLRAAVDKDYAAVASGTRSYLAGKLQESSG